MKWWGNFSVFFVLCVCVKKHILKRNENVFFCVRKWPQLPRLWICKKSFFYETISFIFYQQQTIINIKIASENTRLRIHNAFEWTKRTIERWVRVNEAQFHVIRRFSAVVVFHHSSEIIQLMIVTLTCFPSQSFTFSAIFLRTTQSVIKYRSSAINMEMNKTYPTSCLLLFFLFCDILIH